MSLDAVWRVYYQMMKTEIGKAACEFVVTLFAVRKQEYVGGY
jgi:hypothetical protein